MKQFFNKKRKNSPERLHQPTAPGTICSVAPGPFDPAPSLAVVPEGM